MSLSTRTPAFRRAFCHVALLVLLPGALRAVPHVFRFAPPAGVEAVSVAGSFNEWVPQRGAMADEDGDGVWERSVDLPPGRHPYKFVVHGEGGDRWIPDPAAEEREDDGQGGENGVLVVRASSALPHLRGDGIVDEGAVEHGPGPLFIDRDGARRLRIRLITAAGDVEACRLEWRPSAGESSLVVPMERDVSAPSGERWAARLPLRAGSYRFLLRDGAGGLATDWRTLDPATIPVFAPPSWVGDSVFYGVFPDRFRNGDEGNDPPQVRPWGEAPRWDAHFGGDLRGVEESLLYLRWLGADGLYLNPVFTSLSYHRYDVADFEAVDPRLGGDDALRSLSRAWRAGGGRLLLDVPFNHSADEHPFFRDVKARGKRSPYWDWYRVFAWPVKTSPRPTYDCWWGFGDLPRLRTDRRPVQDYLLSVALRWLPLIDGWRLDAAEQVDDRFWRRLRPAVKERRPGAWLVGEIWSDGAPWLQGAMFDSVMNYPLQKTLVRHFARGEGTAADLAAELAEARLRRLPRVARAAMTFLSTHDTRRFLTEAGGSRDRLLQAFAFLMAHPGSPMIFYGDELGFSGGKDPENRPCMRWSPDPRENPLARRVRELVALRRAEPALRSAHLRIVPSAARPRCFVMERLRPRGDGAMLVFFADEGMGPWQPEVELVGGRRIAVDVVPSGGVHHLLVEEPWPRFRVRGLR